MEDTDLADGITVEISEPGQFDKLPGSSSGVIKILDDKTVIKRFDEIRVSTMTLVTLIRGNIDDMEAVFYSIPVYQKPTQNIRNTISEGTITSIRWNGKCRGDHGKFFKNSAFIDIYTDNKKLSTKLSGGKIQMCGAYSLDMGEKASKYIVHHVLGGFEFIKMTQNDISLYNEAISWLLDNSKGSMLITYYPNSVLNKKITIYHEQPDNLVVFPRSDIVPPKYEPIIEEIRYRFSDIKYLSELKAILEYFPEVDVSILGSINGIIRVGRSMVNYNYHLGFPIDRLSLATKLKEEDFMVEFANTASSYVRVEMFSDISNDEHVIRRSDSNSKQSFLIYTSGNIMHSGPGGQAMSNCYYQLMVALVCIRDQISTGTI